MSVVNWIISNVFTQAGIVIALIAMLGLLLQRKGTGEVIIGTFKTLLGFKGCCGLRDSRPDTDHLREDVRSRLADDGYRPEHRGS